MENLSILIAFIVSLAVSIFVLSNIFFPLFYALPKVLKERKKNGNMDKCTPIYYLFITPIIWSFILIFFIYFTQTHFTEYIYIIYSSLGFSFFGIIKQIGKKNKEIEYDFNNSYEHFYKPKN